MDYVWPFFTGMIGGLAGYYAGVRFHRWRTARRYRRFAFRDEITLPR